MKIKASLLILLIITTTFLYNVVGCHLLLSLQKEQHWIKAMQKTSNYKVLKLNASIYTFVDDADYENINENVTINHKIYHVFKKKIKDNILYLYYLPNKLENETSINLKKLVDSDLFENTNLNKKPLEKLLKSLLKDYVPTTYSSFEMSLNTDFTHFKNFIFPTGIIHSGYIRMAFSPPKLV